MKIFSAQLKGTTTVVEGATASITGSFTGSIAGIDINATNTFTASTIARLNSIETISSSNDGRVGNIELFTSSTSARLNSIETTSASVDTLNTAQNSRLDSLEIKTGSLATTGSNTFIGTQTITGSLFISSNLIVQGTSSLQNITASAVSIGANIINLNTANPAIRYAGLVIGDSGSVGGSGSFLYDSVQDEMLFIHRGASAVVTSSVTLMGPETYDNVGSETYLTNNRIPKGRGNEHLGDSNISDNGTTIVLNSNTEVSGSIKSTGHITSVDRIAINKTNNTTLGASLEYDSAVNQVYIYNHINGGYFSVYTNGEERLQISALGATSFRNSISVSGVSTFGTSTTNGDVTIITNGTPFVIRGRTTYDRAFLGLTWDINPDTAVLYGNTIRFNVNPTFGTNAGTTAMTILANGKVGIGETTPDNSYQGLTIKGTDPSLRLKTTSASGWVWTEYVTSAGTNNFSMGVNQTLPYFGIKAGAGLDSPNFIMLSNGNVGIGTTTLPTRLTVRGTPATTSTNYEFKNISVTSGFSSGYTGTAIQSLLAGYDGSIYGTDIGYGYDGTGYVLMLSTNDDTAGNPIERVRINSAGLGVGITPTLPLDVLTSSAGALNTVAQIQNTNFTAGNRSFLRVRQWLSAGSSASSYFGTGQDGNLYIIANNSARGGDLIINLNDGNTGLGGTPSSNSKLNVAGSLKVNNSVYNWFQVGTNNWDNHQFLHLKTNISSGASGNVDHTMSLFTGRLYSYSSAYIREGSFGFHNWSGILYNPVTTGNFWAGGYSSSDGFVVLIVALGGGSYFGVNIDWHQSFPYGFRDRTVTSYAHSNSSSALY